MIMNAIIRWLQPVYGQTGLSIGLLFLRLIMGAAFVLHGMDKIAAPFTWMQGAPVPAFLQAAAAVSEYFGGMALIIGLLTRPAAFGLFCTMTVAAVMAHIMRGDPFVSATGGASYEMAAIYWACALLLMLSGAGRFSLDAVLFKHPKQNKKP
jgi:putative oxidoreductase